MTTDEDLTERRARRAVEKATGYTLERVDPQESKEKGRSTPQKPDYRVASPTIAFEVKEFTSEDFRSLRGRMQTTAAHTPSPDLTGLWSYTLPAYNAVEALDDSLYRTKLPKPRTIAKKLIPHLKVLEQYGLSDYRHPDRYKRPEVAAASAAIHALVRGGQCVCGAPMIEPAIGPGVLAMGVSLESLRTGDPNTFAGDIQQWLNVKSTNMRASLAAESGEHHGIIVIDPWTVSEGRSAEDQGAEFLPTLQLQLPPEIDVLWVLVGSLLLRYEKSASDWTTQLIDDDDSDARSVS